MRHYNILILHAFATKIEAILIIFKMCSCNHVCWRCNQVSETLVLRNGDFLVRDSLTSVGDFVLTCRWDNEVLHFKISKVLVKSNETKACIPGLGSDSAQGTGPSETLTFAILPQVQYVLEADTFDSVQELVRFYVGQRKPVSQSNGVHIYCPVSRTLPLRYLEATFALATSKQGSAYSPSSPRGAHIKRRSVTMMDGLTTEKMISHRCVPQRLSLPLDSLSPSDASFLVCVKRGTQRPGRSRSGRDPARSSRTRTGACVRLQVVLLLLL